MPRRPARCYREMNLQPYTRKEYIKRLPQSRITKFDMGNIKQDFPVTLYLIAEKRANILHNALEAARVATNRRLERKLGRANYHFKIKVYPHNILREHKLVAVAQGDRFQKGMKKAFGKPFSVAATVNKGQVIMFVETYPENIQVAREALKIAESKLPISCRIKIEKTPEVEHAT